MKKDYKSLILGITSFLLSFLIFGLIPSLFGIPIAIINIKKKMKYTILGLILSILGFVISVFFLVLVIIEFVNHPEKYTFGGLR